MEGGQYVICDPCYVISRSRWKEFCSLLYATDEQTDVIGLDGHEVYVSHTHDGDGTYRAKYKGEYISHCDVDSGLLAAVPKLLEWLGEYESGRSCTDQAINRLNVTIGEVAEFSYDDRIIKFGPVSINTKSNR